MPSRCRISAERIIWPFVETVVFMLGKITSYLTNVNPTLALGTLGAVLFLAGLLSRGLVRVLFFRATYTGVGYGDLALPKPWRMLGPLETLTAILMCGLSTGLFFALVVQWISNWMQRKKPSQNPNRQ